MSASQTISLQKLLGKRSGLGVTLGRLFSALDARVRVHDSEGRLILGELTDGVGSRSEVCQGERTIGWVESEGHADTMAELLAALAGMEAEKKALAAEVLDRYRELSLLYNLSETLAASPQPATVARAVLDEAAQLIRAAAGAILIIQEDPTGETALLPVAVTGSAYQLKDTVWDSLDLLKQVLQTGKAELDNNVPADLFLEGKRDGPISVLGAPLRTNQRTLGAILLISDQAEQYTAGDLKLLNTIALQVAPAIEIARLYQVAVEKARMERELQLARQVQISLLPTETPQLPGWEFAAYWRPAREVSGDYYDFIPERDGNLALVIADVTDKGMPASLYMVFARSALRASLETTASPAQIVQRANQMMCQESYRGLFVTLIFARLNPSSGQVTYVNAGHNPAIHYRAQTGQTVILEGKGYPIGIFEDATYEQHTVQLDSGDFILLYTDGVTEAMDANQELFGMDRLERFVYDHRQDPVQEFVKSLTQSVDEYSNFAPPLDDVTLTIIRRI